MKNKIIRLNILFNVTIIRLFISNNRNSKKKAFLDLKNAQNGNYYFDLVQHLLAKDYEVFLKYRPHFIYAHTKYFKPIFFDRGIKHYYFVPPSDKDDLYFTDYASEIDFKGKAVQIRYDSFSDKLKTDISFPFGISPAHFINQTLPDFHVLRNSKRKMKLFFSGNTDKKGYDNKNLESQFEIINRYNAIEIIRKRMPKRSLAINSPDNTYSKLHLKIWEWNPQEQKNLEQRIENSTWFETLASSSFFLALPGIIMPLCYNLIESMAVGCIPILQYGDLMEPKLQHGKNCLKYKNEDDLIAQLQQAISMPEENVAVMHDNVVSYFEENHSYGRIIEKITESDKHKLQMKMYCGAQSLLHSGLKI